jgi:hypothetical protein
MSPDARAVCDKYEVGVGKSWWCRTVSDPRNINDLHQMCEDGPSKATCTCKCHD